MKPVLLKYLRCVACKERLHLYILEEKSVKISSEEDHLIQQTRRNKADYETEILRGVLHCEKCGSAYPIVDGVPRMYRGAEKDFPMSDAPISLTTKKLPANKDERKVQTSFSDQWNEFKYEENTIWLWTIDERIDTFCEELCISSPAEFQGKLMVECGSGPAVLSMALSKHYSIEIIALDMSYVFGKAFKENTSNFCHFIQSSVLAIPLAEGFSDITHSHGVLHHTYNTKAAFDAIAKLTKPQGVLYVWLYGRKKGWNRFRFFFIRNIRFVTARLPYFPQTVIVWIMAAVTAVMRFFKRNFLGTKQIPYTSWSQFLVGIRDKYTPLYAHEHTEQEVKKWFETAGYIDVQRRIHWNKTKVWIGSTDLSIKGRRK